MPSLVLQPRAILTRPASQNEAWRQALTADGIEVAELPLIAITPNTSPALDEQRRQIMAALDQYSAIMHVSPNAVQYFWSELLFKQWQMLAMKVQAPRLWAPGPGTAAALIERGFPPSAIDQPANIAQQFDSEALWSTVNTQVKSSQRYLIVRGDTPSNTGNKDAGDTPKRSSLGVGRDWLMQRLHEQQANTEFCVVYQRAAPRWSATQQTLIHSAAEQRWVWIFSSSEGLQNLLSSQAKMSWTGHRAIATHPRIADYALRAGFTKVHQCKPEYERIAALLMQAL